MYRNRQEYSRQQLCQNPTHDYMRHCCIISQKICVLFIIKFFSDIRLKLYKCRQMYRICQEYLRHKLCQNSIHSPGSSVLFQRRFDFQNMLDRIWSQPMTPWTYLHKCCDTSPCSGPYTTAACPEFHDCYRLGRKLFTLPSYIPR